MCPLAYLRTSVRCAIGNIFSMLVIGISCEVSKIQLGLGFLAGIQRKCLLKTALSSFVNPCFANAARICVDEMLICTQLKNLHSTIQQSSRPRRQRKS